MNAQPKHTLSKTPSYLQLVRLTAKPLLRGLTYCARTARYFYRGRHAACSIFRLVRHGVGIVVECGDSLKTRGLREFWAVVGGHNVFSPWRNTVFDFTIAIL